VFSYVQQQQPDETLFKTCSELVQKETFNSLIKDQWLPPHFLSYAINLSRAIMASNLDIQDDSFKNNPSLSKKLWSFLIDGFFLNAPDMNQTSGINMLLPRPYSNFVRKADYLLYWQDQFRFPLFTLMHKPGLVSLEDHPDFLRQMINQRLQTQAVSLRIQDLKDIRTYGAVLAGRWINFISMKPKIFSVNEETKDEVLQYPTWIEEKIDFVSKPWLAVARLCSIYHYAFTIFAQKKLLKRDLEHRLTPLDLEE
jgi:hypothetical protein